VYDFRNYYRLLNSSVAILSILTIATFSAIGQTNGSGVQNSAAAEPDARAELNLGVEAYKNAHYDEAIGHFQRATELAPDLTMARSYLGTALAQNVIPGLDTPENLKIAQRAIDIFTEVLAKEPHDLNSMKQIAAVYYNTKKLDDARVWQKKVMVEDPKDPEAAYTIAVIDWTQAYQNAQTALTAIGMNDDGMGNTKAPKDVLETIKMKNGELVEEALQYLNQALESRPNYDDAMAYVNLVYRRKADVDWENDAARNEDLAKAKEWITKSMAARKANEEKRIVGQQSTQP
jgi:tetratricopeptide (TPR) repeat protein